MDIQALFTSVFGPLVPSKVNLTPFLLGPDRFGKQWYGQIQSDGTQLWGTVLNGVIRNGGLNATPQPYNPQTGLSSPTKP